MTEVEENFPINEAEEEAENTVVNLADLDDDDDDYYGMDDDCFDFEENCEVREENKSPKRILFEMIEEVPSDHCFKSSRFVPVDSVVFAGAMCSERTMMMNDLPEGIHVKMYENRLDLCTVMIEGPAGTPYEGCLFLFDCQVSRDYPKSAPNIKFLSFSNERLNPNLYACGKVCLSLLGTWPGKPEEKWSAQKSSLLQLFVSIQGLILVSEPFYNEPAFDSSRGKMNVQSGTYNRDAIKIVIETMTKQLLKPPQSFKNEILNHYRLKGIETCDRFQGYLNSPTDAPFPLSEENCIFETKELQKLKEIVMKLNKPIDE